MMFLYHDLYNILSFNNGYNEADYLDILDVRLSFAWSFLERHTAEEIDVMTMRRWRTVWTWNPVDELTFWRRNWWCDTDEYEVPIFNNQFSFITTKNWILWRLFRSAIFFSRIKMRLYWYLMVILIKHHYLIQIL